MATLTIQRTSEFTNRVRDIGIYIDDQKVGVISNGESKEFSVAPGVHNVYCKIDWCTSPTQKVEINDTQKKTLRVGSFVKGKWYRMFLSIYYSLFAKNEYLTLEEVSI